MLKLGLLGEKLAHSQSPEIHQKLLEEKGLTGTYELIELPRATFTEDFHRLKGFGYHGLNVTIPYKETILPLLDELSPEARDIGAVNTIAFKGNRTIGHNTDYYGFLTLLNHCGLNVKGKEAVILGSGGASRAVTQVLLDNGIVDITYVSRSKNGVRGYFTISYDYFRETDHQWDLIINCTPVGMYPQINQSPIPKKSIRAEYIIDLIYNPEKTLLLKYAEELGIKNCNGSIMLLEQARKAQEIWMETIR